MSFSFYKFIYMDDHQEDAPPHEKIGLPDSKDHQTLLVPTDVCNTYWGVLITHAAASFVASLGGLKNRASRGK